MLVSKFISFNTCIYIYNDHLTIQHTYMKCSIIGHLGVVPKTLKNASLKASDQDPLKNIYRKTTNMPSVGICKGPIDGSGLHYCIPQNHGYSKKCLARCLKLNTRPAARLLDIILKSIPWPLDLIAT